MSDDPLNKKGFTLIELVITIGLVVMVLSLGYNLILFGTKSFTRGITQADLQQNARFIDDALKKELRTAGQLLIGTSNPNLLENCIYLSGNSLYLNESVIGVNVDDVTVKMDIQSEKAILQYVITINDNNQNYEISNQIILYNIFSTVYDSSYETYLSLKSGYMIYYDMDIPASS